MQLVTMARVSLCMGMRSRPRVWRLKRRSTAQSRRQSDKRTRSVSNDTLSTMKAFFWIILAFALSIGSAEAGPVHTAAHVAESTAETAQNVGHSAVKSNRRDIHTRVYTLTP